MSSSKVERLVNLVIALLSTRQFLTAEKIRATVAGYDDSASDEAFSRMFERDKNELRDLGIPLETGAVSRYGTTEGYRINRDAYELPDIELDSEESAAVAIAAALWESPELTAAAQGALLKLRAAGVRVDADPTASVAATPARSRGDEQTLERLLAAVKSRSAVRFDHRGGRATRTARTVEPWGVVTVGGRWYLVAHDRDRDAVRTFRVSRITGVEPIGRAGEVTVPDGVDLRAIAEAATASTDERGHARVWIADGRAEEVRRLGTRGRDRVVAGRAGADHDLEVRSWSWVTRVIAGHGGDAIVLGPDRLREAVVRTLERAVADAVPPDPTASASTPPDAHPHRTENRS